MTVYQETEDIIWKGNISILTEPSNAHFRIALSDNKTDVVMASVSESPNHRYLQRYGKKDVAEVIEFLKTIHDQMKEYN